MSAYCSVQVLALGWHRQHHVCNWRKKPNTAQRADVTSFCAAAAAALFVVDFFSRTSFFLKFAWIVFSIWIVYYASFRLLWIVVSAFHRFVYLLTRLHYTWARISLYYYERASERAGGRIGSSVLLLLLIFFSIVVVVIISVISVFRSPFPRCNDIIVVFILYSSSSLCACFFLSFIRVTFIQLFCGCNRTMPIAWCFSSENELIPPQ